MDVDVRRLLVHMRFIISLASVMYVCTCILHGECENRDAWMDMKIKLKHECEPLFIKVREREEQ